MRPLTEQEKDTIRQAHPDAAPGEIDSDLDEYERLVAQMFQRDPDAPVAAPAATTGFEPADPGIRLAALHRKLFRE
jgi:hypothetical protein